MGMTEQARLIAERIVAELDWHTAWIIDGEKRRADLQKEFERIAFEVMADEKEDSRREAETNTEAA